MEEIEVKSFSLGEFATNAYFILNREKKTYIIIDAPQGIKSIVENFSKKGFRPLSLFLTHGHIDHIQGLKELDLPFYIHYQDEKFLLKPELNLSSFLSSPLIIKKKPSLLKEDRISLWESLTLEVIHTPGHTPGSVSFKLNNYLFSGDTLFYDSVGRTDFSYADFNLLCESLKKITSFDENTIVFPGHGPSTTLKREKRYNPFLKECRPI